MDTPWRIELLGRLRATQGERVVSRFRARRTGSLLAYLAYHLNRPHPRVALIELLWPGLAPHLGRANLRRELSSLRRQLEPPGVPPGAVILADRDLVQLNSAACATDAVEFEAALQSAARARGIAERTACLTRAAELYQGELLPGYFEEWVLPERQRLAERYLDALEQLTASREQAGDYQGAIQWARRAVAGDPLREEGHHTLIRLLQAAGQSAAALRQYQELERLLARELNAAPSAETRNLIHAAGGHRAPPDAVGVTAHAPPADGAPDMPRSSSAPTGTVTFLVAEIGDGMVPGGENDALRSLMQARDGHELPAARSVLQFAFARASDALAAAIMAQETVGREGEEQAAPATASSSPPPGASRSSLRIALHTAEVASGQQVQQSPALQHATRLVVAAHPGQVLLSEKSAILLRDDLEPKIHLLDLGPYRLRTEARPERLFQACFLDMPLQEFPPPNALPAYEGSLPLQFTRFFGREEEIAHLCECFSLWEKESIAPDGSARLITLTGPGGSGKTRLVLAVAEGLRAPFHGAVWFVPLQDLTDARLIPDKLIEALRLPRSPQLQPVEQAISFLSRQPSLLLLDNFEHLVTDGARLVETLLEQVPALVCLVTSRQRLSLAGEREFRVPPLPVPDGGGRMMDGVTEAGPSDHHPLHGYPTLNNQLSALAGCASVRLFVDRAQAVQPDFQVTGSNAGAIGEICRRLEGLPLALELAAARAGVLTPTQMLERLSQRFELLVSPQRRVSPRHRSLRAALEWSYQLLSPELQRFFARLSVFQGGWTLEAAEAVCEEPRALDYLQQLRECTLVQAAEDGGEMRFRLLETLREYGGEQLAPEELTATAHRHASYYLALAERTEPELVRSGQVAWFDRLKRELDNLRAALAWLEGSRRIQEAVRLGAALREFITPVAGDGTPAYSGDNSSASQARLHQPSGLAFDAAGDLYIADVVNYRVRKIGLDGTITTVAGTGRPGFSGDGGKATDAQLNGPARVVLDGAGNLFISDFRNHRVRKVTPDGIIVTVAGSGPVDPTSYTGGDTARNGDFAGDNGPATGARLNGPVGLAMDAYGNLFIGDYGNHRVRKIEAATGMITTVTGNGHPGSGGDGGLATEAQLNGCVALVVDSAGNLFIADNKENRVRKVTPDGTITTVAGTGEAGFSGDGGKATDARLNAPQGLAVDNAGTLFIADNANSRVRMVNPEGVITTAAGNGGTQYAAEGGLATETGLKSPNSLAIDALGNLLIADDNDERLLKVFGVAAPGLIAGKALPQ